MGNGNCKQCKCNNCINKEKNMSENIFDKNLEVIKNDAYESFDNEIKNIKREINYDIENENLNKIMQIQKNENEKNTTNNNIDNITDNKKEKTEFENSVSINNIDKKETINNIKGSGDKIPKEEIKENNQSKKNNYEEVDINLQGNIHIASINIKKHKNNDDINLKISKDGNNKSKGKLNRTRNNIDELNENNNDLVYITNKNKNVCDNFESNNYIRENKHYLCNNNVNYIKKYAFNLNNDNNDNEDNIYKKSNDMSEKNTNILFEVNKNINIFNIISKNKLLKLNENSILCNSILEKIIKIPEKSKIIYNERFCVLTKKKFSYYKSKESYLNLGKPLLLIDLKNIIKVEQTILDDTSYYFGLICMINDETKKYVDKINTFINAGENNNEEFLLGFRSKNKDLIIKWIVILNYFVENYEY